ncbi:MAG: ACP S-malonyltransferase, partial [Alphaproteobacteria bacterium]
MNTPTAVALTFPGQGSQTIGMAVELMEQACTRDLFELADHTLGFHLSRLMREGDMAELTQTHNAQPALFVAGMAAFTYLTKQAGKTAPQLASHLLGHSLGEYTAACATGFMPFEQGLQLVRARGQAMSKVTGGAMAAVLGLELETIQHIATASGCFVANDNAPGQVVISGLEPTIATAEDALKAAGAKRVLRLPVSGAFHTPA